MIHIIKSEAEPTTTRQKQYDSNPHEIIPILFNMQNVLQTRYYNITEREQEIFSSDKVTSQI